MTQQTYTPDWSKAPPQANWHARDSDGCGFWYDKRPALSRGFWASTGNFTFADSNCPVLGFAEKLDNWRDTLTARPPQLCDISQNLSDYFTGKTSFINAYVDLLLARMANEERFSGSDNVINKYDLDNFDVVTFVNAHQNNAKSYAVVCNKADGNDLELTYLTHHHEAGGFGLFGIAYFGNLFTDIRTITELEAVEFRQAMEAVYGS